MYICSMYICVFVYVYICIYVYTYICTYIETYTYIYVYIYLNTYMYLYIYISIIYTIPMFIEFMSNSLYKQCFYISISMHLFEFYFPEICCKHCQR